ncbi:hypothetical protein D3C85_1489180 [compost metagenome]
MFFAARVPNFAESLATLGISLELSDWMSVPVTVKEFSVTPDTSSITNVFVNLYSFSFARLAFAQSRLAIDLLLLRFGIALSERSSYPGINTDSVIALVYSSFDQAFQPTFPAGVSAERWASRSCLLWPPA